MSRESRAPWIRIVFAGSMVLAVVVPVALARADAAEESPFAASRGDSIASGAALDSSAVLSRTGPVMAAVGALIGLGLVALEYPIAAAVLSESDGNAVLLVPLAVATIGAAVLVTTGIAAPDKRWSVVYLRRESKRHSDP